MKYLGRFVVETDIQSLGEVFIYLSFTAFRPRAHWFESETGKNVFCKVFDMQNGLLKMIPPRQSQKVSHLPG